MAINVQMRNLQLRQRVIAETWRSSIFAQLPTQRKERHLLPSLEAEISVPNTW
jgi:hypothetical protein